MHQCTQVSTTTPVASPRISKSSILCTALWFTFSCQQEERTLQGNTVLGTKLEREKPKRWSRTTHGNRYCNQTTAKHQRCQQLDLLKGKGNPCNGSRINRAIKEWCGKGMGQACWKQRPKQLSKAITTTTSSWPVGFLQGSGLPTKHITWPEPILLAEWPMLFDSQLDSLRDWQMAETFPRASSGYV